MTSEALIAIVEELELEPVTKTGLIDRITTEGATRQIRDEIKKLVEERIEYERQQQELIDQALAAVAETDAEAAKIAQDAENELKIFEETALKELSALDSAPAPVSAAPTAAPIAASVAKRKPKAVPPTTA